MVSFRNNSSQLPSLVSATELELKPERNKRPGGSNRLGKRQQWSIHSITFTNQYTCVGLRKNSRLVLWLCETMRTNRETCDAPRFFSPFDTSTNAARTHIALTISLHESFQGWLYYRSNAIRTKQYRITENISKFTVSTFHVSTFTCKKCERTKRNI